MKRKFKNVVIDYEGESFSISIPLFDEEDEINIESHLSIDITNLPGELITTPIVMNKFGLLLADAEDKVRSSKMDYEIWEAKEIEKFRKKRTETKEKNPTVAETQEYILLHILKPKKYGRYLEAQKSRDYLNSIYWSFKEKQENLKKLSLTISGEIDSVDVERALRKLDTIKFNSKVQ